MIKVLSSSTLAYVIIFAVVIVEDEYSGWLNKLGRNDVDSKYIFVQLIYICQIFYNR